MKICLSDNRNLILDGYRSILKNEKNIQVACSYHDGIELIEFLKKNIVDVILVDLEMPKLNGFELLDFLMKNYRSEKVIIVSGYKHVILIKELVARGAAGYLSKTLAVQDLLKSIHKVQADGLYFSIDIQESLVTTFLAKEEADVEMMLSRALSPMELKVLIAHLKDLKPAEMRAETNLKQSTIRSYRQRILYKLNETDFLLKRDIKTIRI